MEEQVFLPFLGLGVQRGHGNIWIKYLVNLHLGLLVDTVLLFGVTKTVNEIIHSREVVMAFPFGPQADLIAMVLDLRFVP